MKKAVVGILAVVGVLAILSMGALMLIGLVAVLGSGEPPVPSRTILEIDFRAGVVEAVPDDPFAQYMYEGQMTVRDVVEALETAATDRRVKGLIAHVGSGGMGMAHIQEIRDAVSAFRESGKPAVAWSETFGEFGPGNGGYYLATAFDEIYLQPSGDIGLTGLIYETTFRAGLYEKLDIVMRMDQRHEYKNAMNISTDTEYTEPFREGMQSLVDSQFSQMVRGIAAGRGLEEGEVRALVDRGPFLASEALEANLVDGLMYRDEVYDLLHDRCGERAKTLLLKPYQDRAGRPNTRGTTVALVHGSGAVTRGASGYSPFDGTVTMGSDTIAGALRAAIDDRKVKAILLRVDSPGGSYIASDTIWRETLRAREAGKPVIVTMGNLAASGGYFVSMNADKIVAQPGTITASIGVFGGKMLTRGMWNKIGLSFDDVRSSANSDQWSSIHDYDSAGYQRFQAGLDRIYEDFTTKVAEGRGLPLERIQQIARGRIWTGEQALELGLVDALGGFDTALDLVRQSLELEADAPIRIKRFPKARSMWDALLGAAHAERTTRVALGQALKAVQPVVRAVRLLAPESDTRILQIPPINGLN